MRAHRMGEAMTRVREEEEQNCQSTLTARERERRERVGGWVGGSGLGVLVHPTLFLLSLSAPHSIHPDPPQEERKGRGRGRGNTGKEKKKQRSKKDEPPKHKKHHSSSPTHPPSALHLLDLLSLFLFWLGCFFLFGSRSHTHREDRQDTRTLTAIDVAPPILTSPPSSSNTKNTPRPPPPPPLPFLSFSCDSK